MMADRRTRIECQMERGGCAAERMAAITRISLSRAHCRIIDFKFYRVGALQGADKVAKMGRLGNNI